MGSDAPYDGPDRRKASGALGEQIEHLTKSVEALSASVDSLRERLGAVEATQAAEEAAKRDAKIRRELIDRLRAAGAVIPPEVAASYPPLLDPDEEVTITRTSPGTGTKPREGLVWDLLEATGTPAGKRLLSYGFGAFLTLCATVMTAYVGEDAAKALLALVETTTPVRAEMSIEGAALDDTDPTTPDPAP